MDLKGYSDAMDALANAAPDEIKSDFKTFADAFKAFASAMSDAGLKPGETPTAAQIAKLSAASQKLSTPKIQAATRHLEAWGQKNCGFSSTELRTPSETCPGDCPRDMSEPDSRLCAR